LHELVSRSIYLCWNAEHQFRASILGTPQPLHPGEIKLAGAINAKTTAVQRTWEYWSARLKLAGLWPPPRGAKASRRAPAKSARATPRAAGKKARRRR